MNYGSVSQAANKLVFAILNPERFMDSKERINKAIFELNITYQKELEMFVRLLVNRTNKLLLNNDACIWQINDNFNDLLKSTTDDCEISSYLIPDNLRFEINKEYFRIINIHEKTNELSLVKALRYN